MKKFFIIAFIAMNYLFFTNAIKAEITEIDIENISTVPITLRINGQIIQKKLAPNERYELDLNASKVEAKGPGVIDQFTDLKIAAAKRHAIRHDYEYIKYKLSPGTIWMHVYSSYFAKKS